jgi:MSHA biogenesis protein MshQ
MLIEKVSGHFFVRIIQLVVLASLVIFELPALAATYTSASTSFNWVNSATHSKVGYNTTPYKFNGGGGCGTTPPILDDTISDLMPIGFTFLYGATSYTTLRIQSNGRVQFGNATCGSGTQNIGPPQTYPYIYPDANLNNTMKVFDVDLDPTNLVDIANYPTAANKTTCNDYTNCYVSYASIGTAPNRQFVVTWYHVPEWVTASNSSGFFDLQVILNENGTFIYQYGPIVHGGTGVAQVGWQLSNTDYGVLNFGASSEPTANTAIIFYISSANPLTSYQFEDGAWSPNGAGQVTDASGNGRPGTAIGTAQEISTGYVCRGASIPANTSATTVDAIKTGVKFSDLGVNMLGQGTIMFWYKSNVAWNGGTAAQLLDATQVNGEWFALTKKATGTLYLEVTDSTGVVRSVETPVKTFAAGTWVHVAITWNFNASPTANSDDLQIFVNGGAPVVSSFTSTGTLSTSLDYVHIGDSPSGLASTQGSINSANGTIDELRLYNFELNQGQVLGESSKTHSCPTFFIDHLELRHSSWSGITCSAGTMTLLACANATCSTLYTSGLVATLSSTGVATLWDSTTGGSTIIIGAGQSSATKNFYTASGTAPFNVVGTGIPVTEANVKKCNGSSGSCVWTSVNDGLLVTVPNSGVITGGKPTAVLVQGVHSSGPTPGAACVPISNLTGAGLNVWSSAISPISFASTATSAGVTVGGAPQVANASSGTYVYTPSSVPAAPNVNGLSFDSNATTTLWLKHMDTGQFNISATLNTAATTTTPALSLSGTGSAKSIPAGFGIVASTVTASVATQTSCASGSSVACDTAAGANARVGSAGSAFSFTSTAALWTSDTDSELSDNPVAPNYAGSIVLSPWLIAPVGGSAGTISITGETLAAGTNSIANQSWSQVGAMRISASGTYLGQAITGQSAVLGRFSPHHLETNVTTQGCGTFTYSGQPITLVTVNAMDGSSAITPNYKGSFARLVTLSDGNGSTGGTFTFNTIAAASFLSGSAAGSPVFTYTDAKTAPITLALRAYDGEISSSGFTEGSALLRSGRLRLQNAYGSELLALPVPLEAQYWNGSSYVRNQLDSCTAVPASSFAMSNYKTNLSNALPICETQLGYTSGTGAFVNGVSKYLRLTKPGAGNNGSVDLTINLNAVNGKTCITASESNATAASIPWFGSNPVSRATFGIYKTPIIYMRENF